MYRVTTPTHTFTLPIDTSTCDEIQVTYKQKGVKLVKHYQDGVLPSGMTLDEKDVIVRLEQEETKLFEPGMAHAQIRVLDNANNAMASQIFSVVINQVLSEDILS